MIEANLLILAAGMGSRYGGLKQLDPMGPSGETVLDYSVYDAIQAGFSRVVFVIRRDFEEAFVSQIGNKFEGQIEIAYAFQDLNDLPDSFTPPEGREKPWGTAHAVLAARHAVTGPFAVINADDFYGRDAYQQIFDFFKSTEGAPELRTCLVGYPLQNTLSEHGSVNRGICATETDSLKSVVEHTEIAKNADGVVTGLGPNGQSVEINADSLVSMNFWGFTPAIFASIEAYFIDFLKEAGSELKSECYLPAVIDHLIQTEQTDCKTLSNEGSWFGVTYPDDKPFVQRAIKQLVQTGDYPSPLH